MSFETVVSIYGPMLTKTTTTTTAKPSKIQIFKLHNSFNNLGRDPSQEYALFENKQKKMVWRYGGQVPSVPVTEFGVNPLDGLRENDVYGALLRKI